ncbi:hypothetical protein PFUGPA_04350 [Plasmodium falciparum Palo Alto/Uganda]|uniref:Uncharacterized protein n=1 Tax=Plasmodium falciparum (isolate Palo Alto / Uganda) TaxID=57270 RepID=W4IXG7_PLAFP|nr:hypothetical protein PFUGPA_04350 [Plasmodium falciparum Palo Alto/Uganda]
MIYLFFSLIIFHNKLWYCNNTKYSCVINYIQMCKTIVLEIAYDIYIIFCMLYDHSNLSMFNKQKRKTKRYGCKILHIIKYYVFIVLCSILCYTNI